MIQVYIPPYNFICIRLEKTMPKAIRKMSFGVIAIHLIYLFIAGTQNRLFGIYQYPLIIYVTYG